VVSYKNSYFTMTCRAFHAYICNRIISAITLPANSVTTQLQKLWIFYYMQYILITARFFSDAALL